MGKLLIVADEKGQGCATPRGLELAHKLGLKVEVVAFTYTPLKQLKIEDGAKAVIRKRLLAEREKVVLFWHFARSVRPCPSQHIAIYRIYHFLACLHI